VPTSWTAMPAAWRWPGGSCSRDSMRSRSARLCCCLGRMPIDSMRRGRLRWGLPFCGIIPPPAPRQLAARYLFEYVRWRRRYGFIFAIVAYPQRRSWLSCRGCWWRSSSRELRLRGGCR